MDDNPSRVIAKAQVSRTYRKSDPLWEGYDTHRDKKKPYKPNKSFKRLEKQKRRAKDRQALIHDQDAPKWKKTNEWNWS